MIGIVVGIVPLHFKEHGGTKIAITPTLMDCTLVDRIVNKE